MLLAAVCRLRCLMVASRKPLVLAVATLIPFLGACSDGAPTQPEDPNSIEAQIRALFPPGPSAQGAALAQIADIRQQITLSATAQARSKTFVLVDFTVTSFREGKLVGGTSASAGNASLRLVNSLYQLVGMVAPNLPEGTLSNDGAAKVVGPEGALIVTPSGAAGVQIPPGAISEQVLVTVTRLPAPPTPGTGPLPTSLRQYPPYYDFSTFPAVPQFGDSVRVGVCQVTDPSSPFYAPEVAHDRLRLAHAVGTSVEVLERVGVNDFLRCTAVTASISTSATESAGWRRSAASIVRGALQLLDPALLYAAHGGLGGKVRSFSPFAAVDPAVATVTVTLASPTVTVGSSVQATTVLKDADGNVLTGRTVTWAASDPTIAIVNGDGLITGVQPSTTAATITATSEGKSGTVTVLVTYNQTSWSLTNNLKGTRNGQPLTCSESMRFTVTQTADVLQGQVVDASNTCGWPYLSLDQYGLGGRVTASSVTFAWTSAWSYTGTQSGATISGPMSIDWQGFLLTGSFTVQVSSSANALRLNTGSASELNLRRGQATPAPNLPRPPKIER